MVCVWYDYVTGQWFHFNDSSVRQTQLEVVAKCKPYILFYIKREFSVHSTWNRPSTLCKTWNASQSVLITNWSYSAFCDILILSKRIGTLKIFCLLVLYILIFTRYGDNTLLSTYLPIVLLDLKIYCWSMCCIYFSFFRWQIRRVQYIFEFGVKLV